MNFDGSGRSWCWTHIKQNAARVLKKIDFMKGFDARSYWQNSDLFRQFPAFFEECRFWGVPIFLGSQNGRNKMKKGQKVASRTCSETRDADFSKNVVFLWPKRIIFKIWMCFRGCKCSNFGRKSRNTLVYGGLKALRLLEKWCFPSFCPMLMCSSCFRAQTGSYLWVHLFDFGETARYQRVCLNFSVVSRNTLVYGCLERVLAARKVVLFRDSLNATWD